MILSGNPVDYLWVFLGGVGLSFTPCVYPLIPVTIGYIGINAGGSKLKGLLLSFIYVTGIAVTYSLLGLFASLTGRLFGSIASHPATYIAVGIIIIFFGLSMLDLFLIPLPNLLKLPAHKKGNYFSTFILGLASGLIIGPCLTPALGAILAYLAVKKNILYGASLLISFAYGMGFILILAGTFSSILVSLPKSCKWLLYIKKICAFVLISIGIWLLARGMRGM